MPRIVVIIAAVLLAISVITTSGAVAMPARSATILPEDCRLLVGEEISLTLDGSIPANARIHWKVDGGGITSVLPGQNAIFIAPPEPAVVTISVSITPAIPGMENPVTRQCIISPLNQAPKGLAMGLQIVN